MIKGDSSLKIGYMRLMHFPKMLIAGFNNIHLKHKLLICYGCLIVLIVYIIGVFAFNRIQSHVYNQTLDSYSQTLVQFEVNVESRLNIYDELVKQIVTDKNLTYAMTNRYASAADYSYEYINTISKAVEIKLKDINVSDAFLLKDNDTMPESSGDLIDITNAYDTWWYEKYFKHLAKEFNINDYILLSRQKIWIATDEDIKPQYIPANNTKRVLKIAIIKPIISNYSNLAGIFELYINYDAVFGNLKTKTEGTNNRTFIMDQRNNIIFSSISDLDAVNQEKEYYIEQLGDKQDGFFEYGDSNNKKLILYTKGDESGWTYFYEIPVDALLASINDIRGFTILIALAGIILSFIIGAAIANMLTKRIVILSNSMKKVENLNLEVEINIDGKDEIGDLAQSYNHMIHKIRFLVEKLRVSQQIQRDSELKALQAQINPHFLYNTLATISWMAMGNHKEKIITMVDNLSIFYRLSLNKGREFLRIAEEVSLVKAYTDIQKVRLDNKISFFFDVSQDIADYYTLKLILQPFVENAIIHGAEKKKSATNITVRGYLLLDVVIFEIIDDGIGMRAMGIPVEKVHTGGYGIKNVHEKIQLLYGNDYGVTILSKLGIGTKATITIPKMVEHPD